MIAIRYSYRGNVLVENVAKGLKEQYRKALLERAEKARRESAFEPLDARVSKTAIP